MEQSKETLAALQLLISASELYLNTLDPVAKTATHAMLQKAATTLAGALNLPQEAPAAQEQSPEQPVE